MLSDNLGSVRDVIDSSGVVQNHISYDSFGQVTGETHPGVGDTFGLAGRPYDAADGPLLRPGPRLRPGDGPIPLAGPVGLGGGDPNLYRYAGNDPIDGTDPTGLKVYKGKVSQDTKVDPNFKQPPNYGPSTPIDHTPPPPPTPTPTPTPPDPGGGGGGGGGTPVKRPPPTTPTPPPVKTPPKSTGPGTKPSAPFGNLIRTINNKPVNLADPGNWIDRPPNLKRVDNSRYIIKNSDPDCLDFCLTFAGYNSGATQVPWNGSFGGLQPGQVIVVTNSFFGVVHAAIYIGNDGQNDWLAQRNGKSPVEIIDGATFLSDERSDSGNSLSLQK